MTYVAQDGNPRERAIAGMAVAMLQGAAAIALIKGLAVTFMPPPESPPLQGEQIYLPPPPPPAEDQPRVQDRERWHDSSERSEAIDRNQGTSSDASAGTPDDGAAAGGQQESTLNDAPEPSMFAPRSPQPRGRPGDWVTANDYPARDLRVGNQGITGFRLSIDAGGRVIACAITRSSGFASLDAAACDKLSRRARFDPASDETGARVTGTYASAVRWTIPD